MVNREQLASHIEDIKQALGNALSDDTISEELENYLQHHVPLYEAKRGIVRKYGGDPLTLLEGAKKKLSEVESNDKYVDLLVKIVSVNPRTITIDGEEKEIFYGLMADDSMMRPFTSWNNFNLIKGGVFEISGAYTKSYRGDPEIQLGNRTRVQPIEDSEDFEVSYRRTLEGQDCKLNELSGGMNNTIVVAKILEIEKRTVMARGEEKTVISGLIGDQTARVGFTAWHDFNLEVGAVVRIAGGYVKEWRSMPQLTFDSRAEVTILSPDDPLVADFSELSMDQPQYYTIEALHKSSGAIDVAIEGVILEIREGSGLIFRCPICNRKLREGECMIHGMQDGRADLRIKAVLDDGTGALTMVANCELTEQLLGKTLDDYLSKYKASGEEPCEGELEELLVAKPFVTRGNIIKDDFGLMLVAKAIEPASLNIQDRAEELAKELEGWP